MFNVFNSAFHVVNQNNYRIKAENQKSLQRVIDNGIELMSLQNLNEEIFMAWQNYATSVLQIISPTTQKYISLDYSTFNLTLVTSNLSVFDKFNESIRFLMSLYPLL